MNKAFKEIPRIIIITLDFFIAYYVVLILFCVLYVISSFTDHNNFLRWALLSPFYKGVICSVTGLGIHVFLGQRTPLS